MNSLPASSVYINDNCLSAQSASFKHRFQFSIPEIMINEKLMKRQKLI